MNEPIYTLPPWTVHQVLLQEQLSGELPWHVKEFGIDRFLWPVTKGVTKIGVVDTGVSPNHPTLEGVIEDAKDFTGSRFGPQDMVGHGTPVSAIIASKDYGIAKGSKVVVGKGLNDEGVGSDRMIVNAINYCASMGCKVINFSGGSPQRSSTIEGCIKEHQQNGIIFVIAAGNDSGPVNWPAASSLCCAVTAIDRQRRLAPFSSRGEAADVCAPGVEIRAAGRGTTTTVNSGTSFSAPFVSGYIAAWIDWRISTGKPHPTLSDLFGWLSASSQDLGQPGRDWEYGLGLPDPEKGFIRPPETQPTVPAPGAKAKVASVVVTDTDGNVTVFDKPKV